MNISKETWDHIKEFIDSNFNDPKREIWPCDDKNLDEKLKEEGYIQISTPLKNSAGVYLNLKDLKGEPRVHYEIIDNGIELHLECDGYKKRYKKLNLIDGYLINKLINKSEKNPFTEKLKRDDKWGVGGIRYYLDEDLSFDNKEKFEKTLKDFINFFDGLICEYNKPVSQESIKEESSDSEVSLRTMDLKTVFGLSLSIPDYQRIYCWEDKNVTDLWNSLIEMQDEYHLGAIILHEKEGKCDIIDGQQRLVTLTIILKELGYDEGKLPLLNASFKSKDARNHIANTMSVIEKLKEELTDEKIKELVDNKQLINNLIFSVLILDNKNLDLAYTFFSNQNSKGVPLSDYDLLKAHHLRYIYLEEEQEHLAKQWNKMIGEEEGLNMLERTLGTHLYRLRKWMRKNGYNAKERLRVKEEFSAAPIMEGIPPFGEKFDFYEKIQGGSHFFAYTNHFVYLYKEFSETKQCKLLQEHLQWETHHRYGSVIETLLFAYFLKFGKQYLSEALFCIAGIIAQHRYNSGRADMDKIRDHARDMEVVMMIDQATSPTFFFAEALPHIKVSGKNQEKIKGRFYNCLMGMFKKLDDFTDKTIKENVRNEYGKQ